MMFHISCISSVSDETFVRSEDKCEKLSIVTIQLEMGGTPETKTKNGYPVAPVVPKPKGIRNVCFGWEIFMEVRKEFLKMFWGFFPIGLGNEKCQLKH